MTDDTQPEAMDLADWLEAVGGGPSAKRCAALLREQHTRIAELESELEAMDAGGVRALSAAPGVTSEQRRFIGVIADKIEDGTLFQSGIYQKKDLARFVRNMLDVTPAAPAASPTPPAEQQAGAVPQGWKAVPANPTPEMWTAAKTVPDPNPPYPPHYGLVWDAMLAASPTPPAEQQAAQVIIDFSQVGTAGPFPVVNGRVSLPDATMQDLARMLRPTYEAEQQAAPKA